MQIGEHRARDGGTVILQTDLTDIMLPEQQQRDRLLDDQVRLVRATLDHLDQGVCIFDRSSRLVGWNQRVGELLSIPVTRFRTGIRFCARLGMSRLDSGQAAVDIGAVSLDRLLRHLAEELSPLARHKGLYLRVMPSSCIVLSDATYLRRILQNLMANALRHTGRGKVLVGARRRVVLLQVWDIGPGIPEDKQDEIVTEFNRLYASASAAPEVIRADHQLDDDALGTDAIRALHTRFGRVPACVITANWSAEVVHDCKNAGLTLLRKPLNPDELRKFLSGGLGASPGVG